MPPPIYRDELLKLIDRYYMYSSPALDVSIRRLAQRVDEMPPEVAMSMIKITRMIFENIERRVDQQDIAKSIADEI